MAVKAELVNKMIAIPQCIKNNFTGKKDYCRWIVYDESEEAEDPGYCRKMYEDAFGKKKIGFITCYRYGEVDLEFESGISEEERRALFDLAKDYHFIDHSDEAKAYIREHYANHPEGHSLMCGCKKCRGEEE
jgi:hypothetical protein